MLKLIARSVAAALVLWSSAASAMAAESPAKMAAATEVGRQFVTLVDLGAAIEAGLTGAEVGGIFTLQPQWRGMLGDAFREQVRSDSDLIVALVARAIAPRFSEEELKAGAVILSDPAIQAGIRNRGKGAPEPSKATKRLIDSPAGKGFMEKFANAGAFLEPVQDQLVVAVLPGVFRGFGEKAEALETARRAAEGLPASKR